MATYNGSHKWHPGWADRPDIQRWIRRELAVGELLNFPCGESTIGDVRVDRDPDRDPDIVADIYNPPFPPRSFDTVYFDPPFDFMWKTGWQGLVEGVWKLADDRLICKTPRRRIPRLKGSEKEWFVAEPKAGSPEFQVWLFQVFYRTEQQLTRYATSN